jgi:hypothetical protein
LKGFLQRILQEIMKRNDIWNIKGLVDEMIIPLHQRSTVYIEACQVFTLTPKKYSLKPMSMNFVNSESLFFCLLARESKKLPLKVEYSSKIFSWLP